MINLDSKAPAFKLLNQDNEQVSLENYKGKWVILYFYPKDNTPGCTKEACDFSLSIKEFEGLNAVILGISPDSVKKHKNFSDKHALNITLFSDPDHKVIEQYEAWKTRKIFGKTSLGVIRSTYIINPEGKIKAIWTGVKVSGHILAVKNKLKSLQENKKTV